MCKLCLKSNEQMEPRESNGEHVDSPMVHTVDPEQGDVSSPNKTMLMTSTSTNSLISCDSFASSCGDKMADVNASNGHNLEVGRPDGGCHSKSSSLVNAPEHIGSLIENKGKKNNNFLDNLYSRISNNSLDWNVDDGWRSDESIDNEPPTFGDDDDMWVIPAAVNDDDVNSAPHQVDDNVNSAPHQVDDDNVNSMSLAMLNDDADEYENNNGSDDADEYENNNGGDDANANANASANANANANANGDGDYDDDDDDDGDDDDDDDDAKSRSTNSSGSRLEMENRKAKRDVKRGRFKNLVKKLLKKKGLINCDKEDENLVGIVANLAWRAASRIKPDAEGKEMDPAFYVNIICIASGSLSESELLDGLVFKNHAAHKHMATATNQEKPRLLLIEGMLGQSSDSARLSSLKTMMPQGNDNFKDDTTTNSNTSLFQKINIPQNADLIDNLKTCDPWPDVILVEKYASRDVLDEALKMKGIIVADMKTKNLKRVAHYTGSPILSSNIISPEKLKPCKSVYFKRFVEEHDMVSGGEKKPSKSLMYLMGYSNRRFCTILLKGLSSEELKKIKYVLRCAVIMAYHFIMDTYFLVEQKAMLSTITYGKTSGSLLTDENSTSVVSETTNNCDNEEPSVGGASTNGVLISNGSEDQLFHVEETSARASVSATPSGFHEEAPISSSISDEFGRVSFSSSAVYQNMSVDVNDQTVVSVPVAPAKGVLDQCDVEAKENSEDKTLHSRSNSLSLVTTAFEDPQNVVDGEDGIRHHDKISSIVDFQRILVLISRRSAKKGTICEQRLSDIKFYQHFDVLFGKFLQDILFDQSHPCKVCNELPKAHIHYYTHRNKQLTIKVQQYQKPFVSGESAGKLWMWSSCRICNETSTKRVLMSHNAHALSFGKFLKISFSRSNNRLSSCGHSFRKEFRHYFSSGSTVARICYSYVKRPSVSVPAQILEFNSSVNRDGLRGELNSVYNAGIVLFKEISSSLQSLGIGSHFKDMLQSERLAFEENFKDTRITDESSHISVRRLLSLNRLRWEILLEACLWDKRLHSLSCHETSSTVTSAAVEAKGSQIFVEKLDHEPKVGADGAREISDVDLKRQMEKDHNVFEGPESFKENCAGEVEGIQYIANTDQYDTVIEAKDIVQADLITSADKPLPTNDVNVQMSTSGYSLPCDSLQKSETTILSFNNANLHTESGPVEEISVPIKEDGEDSSVVNKDASENSSGYRLPISEDSWIWNPFPQIREECLKNLRKQFVPKLGYHHNLKFLHNNDEISQLVNEESWKLHIPLSEYMVSEYHGEISSVIAFALAVAKDPPLERSSSEPVDWFLRKPINMDTIKSAPSMPISDSRSTNLDGSNTLESTNFSVNLGPKPSKYSVVIIYEKEFLTLRSRCCPSELDYIASLSRCKIWDAKGGKSKSFFAKTLDERLIIKEIKKTELHSFMNLANDYFNHMQDSYTSALQTCLAKILGIYQVTVRDHKSGRETKHDLMVQENLSFGRNITCQYDLKGALHGRLTTIVKDGAGDVLLDQNFVKDNDSNPLSICQSSKRILQRAVWNDTEFLKNQEVMDYSLLVGIDDENKELICGIIDYLRTYTWDKKLEAWVKSSLVVPKNLRPTIVSPVEYKSRFRKFMDTQFMVVPDCWCAQRSSKACTHCSSNGGSNRSLSKLDKQKEDQ